MRKSTSAMYNALCGFLPSQINVVPHVFAKIAQDLGRLARRSRQICLTQVICHACCYLGGTTVVYDTALCSPSLA